MELTSSFPRVLIVGGEPFQPYSASGLTMSRLFCEWPVGALACLYTADLPPDSTAGIQHRRVPLSALRGVGRLLRTSGVDRTKVPASGVSTRITTDGWCRKQIRMALDLVPYRLTEDIDDWVSTFRPELIYSMFGSARVARIALGIATDHGLPLVPHFMDDWPQTLYRDSILGPWLRIVLKRQLHCLLAGATVRLTIGDEMATAYERRYGGPFLPFMNCVELEPLSEPPVRDTIRLTYLGGLHLNRWRSLADIGAAAEAVSRQGTPVELLIYANGEPSAVQDKALNRPPYMRLAGHVPPNAVAAVQRDADVLVHVEAFDRVSRGFTRYSISTKIPEYMAAGRPILAYGPAEAASINYVAGSRCGMAVSERSAGAIQGALAELASSPSSRRDMGLRGRRVAETRHEAAGQRTDFVIALRHAVINAA